MFVKDSNSSTIQLSIEDYKYRYRTLQNKIRYYTNLESSKGELTSKQQAKYNELIKQLNELKSNIPNELPSKKKYHSYDEYLEANKEHAKQRYQRLKDDEEFKKKQKEYYKSHYVYKRPTRVKSADSSPSEYSSESPFNSDDEEDFNQQ